MCRARFDGPRASRVKTRPEDPGERCGETCDPVPSPATGEGVRTGENRKVKPGARPEVDRKKTLGRGRGAEGKGGKGRTGSLLLVPLASRVVCFAAEFVSHHHSTTYIDTIPAIAECRRMPCEFSGFVSPLLSSLLSLSLSSLPSSVLERCEDVIVRVWCRWWPGHPRRPF